MKVLTGVQAVPDLFQGAKAWAEEAAKPAAKDSKTDAAKAASPLPPGMSVAAAKPAAPVCAPTAAELAHEAGLSPGELQVLQSLQARRGQLDQREQGMDVQMQLLAAAEAKLDAKLQALNGAKAEIRDLLGQTDQAQAAEVMRLVGVYSAMKPRDAAARMALLTDEVRLPIAAKMKDRSLGQILAQMNPADAKAITEKLAARFNIKAIADAKAALNPQAPAPAAAPPAAAPTQQAKAAPAPAKPVQQAAATPAKPKPKPAKPRLARNKPAKPQAVAANTTPDKPQPYAPSAPASAKPAGAAPAPAAPAAKQS